MTITNVNFDDGSIEKQIRKMLAVRDEMKKSVQAEGLHDAAVFSVDSRESMLKKPILWGYSPLKMKIYVH